MPVVSKLCFYPVKSLHGITVDEAELTVRGLKYDRNWMITDETGHFLTQRIIPKMASIHVHFSGEKLVFDLEKNSGYFFKLGIKKLQLTFGVTTSKHLMKGVNPRPG